MSKSSSLPKKDLELRTGWKLHEKLSKNYTTYLTKNKNKPDVRLYGNYNYYNRPISYFLEKPNSSITNTNLTPIPVRSKQYVQKENQKKEYSSIQKSVVTMRRIEYNNKIRSIKKNPNSDISLYYLRLIVLIQREWKKIYKKQNTKITKIQKIFRGYLINKNFTDVLRLNKKFSKFSFIIQKVLFLNFCRIRKINKDNLTGSFMDKLIFIPKPIIYLQSYIKHFLKTKHCKNIYNKKKSVFVKPINNLLLFQIRKIQRAVIVFLERLHSRKKLVKPVFCVKIHRPISKILFLQKFMRYAILRKKEKPLIPKISYRRNYFFSKEIIINKPCDFEEKKRIENQRIIIPKKQEKKIKHRKNLTNYVYMTKIHPNVKKVIYLQKEILSFLFRRRASLLFLPVPSHQGLVIKVNKVIPNKHQLQFLQREVKYFIRRKRLKDNIMTKIKLPPMKFTKTIQTATEKIFERLSRLRIDYDKDLIAFLVKLNEMIRRLCARKWFYKLQNKKRQINIKVIKKEEPKQEKKIVINPVIEDPLDIICKEEMPQQLKDMDLEKDKNLLKIAKTYKTQLMKKENSIESLIEPSSINSIVTPNEKKKSIHTRKAIIEPIIRKAKENRSKSQIVIRDTSSITDVY